MVDFPDADRPVNQMVRPRCFRRENRSARVSRAGWKVMLLMYGVSVSLLKLQVEEQQVVRELSLGQETTHVAIAREGRVTLSWDEDEDQRSEKSRDVYSTPLLSTSSTI